MHSRMGRVCAATARNRNGVIGVVGTIITLSTILLMGGFHPGTASAEPSSVPSESQGSSASRLPIQDIEGLIKVGKFTEAESAISVWEQSPVHAGIASTLRKQLSKAKLAAHLIDEAESKAKLRVA